MQLIRNLQLYMYYIKCSDFSVFQKWTGKNNRSVGKMGKTSLTVYTCMDKLYCKLNWFFLTPKNNKQFLDFF